MDNFLFPYPFLTFFLDLDLDLSLEEPLDRDESPRKGTEEVSIVYLNLCWPMIVDVDGR